MPRAFWNGDFFIYFKTTNAVLICRSKSHIGKNTGNASSAPEYANCPISFLKR